ncbi:AAA family ATPase [Nonomuraea sp. NPDC059023]|uniref:DUF7779 domain-containing protein n=1 Tax=unclassified Nonomuraea TaxID=2593643 RepID=UPI00369DACE2
MTVPDEARGSDGGRVQATGGRSVAVGGDNLGVVATGPVHLPSRAAPAVRRVRLAARPPRLAGRDEVLAGLRARLTGSPRLPCVVVVHGLGGVGKTSLVVEYAHRHLHDYGLVWQVPAEDASTAMAGLAALLGARELVDVADPIDQVHALLAARTEPWLLIVDNAPGAEALQGLLPVAGPGHVLVTSRAGSWPPVHGLELPVLDAEVAAGFLLECSGHDDGAAAAEVVAELGALPLALEQAGAYMADTGTTMAGYLALLRERRAELLAHGQPWGYRQRVASTWQLSFDQLADADPSAIALLRLLACYAPENIPYRMLLSEHAFGELPSGELAVNTAISALRRYSLISRPADGLVSVHRLVQAVTLDQLTPDQQQGRRQVAGRTHCRTTRKRWRTGRPIGLSYRTRAPSSRWPHPACVPWPFSSAPAVTIAPPKPIPTTSTNAC